MAAGADAFLVTTHRRHGAVVRRDAHGVRLDIETTQDGGNFGTLHLDDAPAEPIGGDAEAALDGRDVATAAYLLGVMDRVLRDYARLPAHAQQFGRPIGSFQALQHRAVDVKVQIALTRAASRPPPRRWTPSRRSATRQAAVSRAKARAADAALSSPAKPCSCTAASATPTSRYRPVPAQGDGAAQPASARPRSTARRSAALQPESDDE